MSNVYHFKGRNKNPTCMCLWCMPSDNYSSVLFQKGYKCNLCFLGDNGKNKTRAAIMDTKQIYLHTKSQTPQGLSIVLGFPPHTHLSWMFQECALAMPTILPLNPQVSVHGQWLSLMLKQLEVTAGISEGCA